jgi:hypothetical protein
MTLNKFTAMSKRTTLESTCIEYQKTIQILTANKNEEKYDRFPPEKQSAYELELVKLKLKALIFQTQRISSPTFVVSSESETCIQSHY